MTNGTHHPSTDRFVYTAPDDPLAQPLVAGLRYEYSHRYREFDVNRTEPYEMDKYEPELFTPARGGNFVLLLRDGRAIAGGAFKKHKDADTAEIKRVWTDPDYRRQGLAQRVMAELEAQAVRQGYGRLYLTTGIRQPEAVALYLNLGFTPLFDVNAIPTKRVGLPFVKQLDVAREAEPQAAPAGVTPSQDLWRLRIVPARYPLQMAGTLFSLVVIGLVLHSVLTNPKWGWGVFAEWFFAEPVLVGLGRTLLLTAMGALFGFTLGTLLALARVSRSPLLSGLSFSYVWLFRSIPVLVLLLLVNNLGYLYETLGLGIPFTDISFFSYPTTQLISPFAAAVIGLTLNQSAYSAEIIRGGILSVDQGQLEAASALGLSRRRQALRIVLPQAMRAILPAGFNNIIGLAKGTSVVYVLAIPDLFYTVQIIYRRNLEVIPLLMVATVWYLVILTVMSFFQHHIERHYSRGALRNPPPPLFAALARWLGFGPRAMQPSLPTQRDATAPTSQREPVPPTAPREATAPIAQGDTPVPRWADRGVKAGEVTIDRVSKSFGALKVLDEVSLRVPAGQVTAILGPSGSGKSTLLRSINHLERVDSGFIAIDGELVGYRRRGEQLHELRESEILVRRVDVGMVFQNFNLFPHMTVLENLIEAPMAVRGQSREQAQALARELLERVGLSEKVDAYPRQLSGGQQQRVAIARAMALKPKVLLFDEPTSALDPELVGEVLDVIKALARSGATLVIVTHEIGFAREVADTVVFMEQGRVLESGPPAQVLTAPTHPRTAAFLGKVL